MGFYSYLYTAYTTLHIQFFSPLLALCAEVYVVCYSQVLDLICIYTQCTLRYIFGYLLYYLLFEVECTLCVAQTFCLLFVKHTETYAVMSLQFLLSNTFTYRGER